MHWSALMFGSRFDVVVVRVIDDDSEDETMQLHMFSDYTYTLGPSSRQGSKE